VVSHHLDDLLRTAVCQLIASDYRQGFVAPHLIEPSRSSNHRGVLQRAPVKEILPAVPTSLLASTVAVPWLAVQPAPKRQKT
jgi:hypothetical protein